MIIKVKFAAFMDEEFGFKMKASFKIFKNCIFIILLPLDLQNYLFMQIFDDLLSTVFFLAGSLGTK